MRIGLQPALGLAQTHQLQQVQGPGAGLVPGGLLPVQADRLGDLAVDGVQRIERGERLLRDQADPSAAQPGHGLAVGPHDLLAIEPDRAGRMERHGIGQQLQDRHGRRRLARTGLADQRHGLALADGKGDGLHRLHDPPFRAETDAEVLHVQQAPHRLRVGGGRPGPQLGLDHQKVFRGSKASRTASPMKMSSDSIRAMTANPVAASQGAWRLLRA